MSEVHEGMVKKGGQNAPSPTTNRPAPPQGSGGITSAELAELRRKAAAYDAGVQAWRLWRANDGKFCNDVFYSRGHAEDVAARISIMCGKHQVVPVRIVEAVGVEA